MPDQLSIGKAVLDLETDQRAFDKGLQQSHDKADSWGKKVGTVAKAAALSLAAVGVSAIALGVTFAKAAAEEEASIERVAKSIQNTGVKNWRALSDETERLIKGWERTTAYADNEMRDALAMLVNMTGDYKQSIQQLPIAMDFARGANIDLTLAAKLLGKVTDENTQALKKYGITVKDGAKETDVLLAVQQKFGGQAAAFAKTAQGQWQILTNQIDNLKEDIGAALLPVFGAFVSKATEWVDELRNGPIPGLIEAIVGKASSIKSAAIEMFGVITGKSPDAGAALKAIAGQEGAEKVMNALAHIRNFVRDDLIPEFDKLAAAVRRVVEQVILPKLHSFLDKLVALTGSADLLTTAITAFGVVLAGVKIVEFTASVVTMTQALWAKVLALRAATVAALSLQMAIALVVAVGILVVTALVQVKETVDLVRENWDTFVYALKTGKLNNIPVFGFFFNIAQKVIGFLETIQRLWDAVSGAFSGAKGPGPTPTSDNPNAYPAGYEDYVPVYDKGTPFVPHTGLAIVHRGEAVIPAEQNVFGRGRGSEPAGVDRPIVIQVPLMVNGRELAYAQASYDNDQGHRYGIGVAG
jgi:hypothetical protein